ncbi:MAG: hypothetical protein ACLPID_01255 [Beijerinckiaceae bacterium]
MRVPHARIVAMGLVSLYAFWPAVAAAETVETAGAISCTIFGWSDDHDPAGLNIRAAPSKDATVIGRLPPPQTQGDDSYAAEFKIIGSRNGWLLISGAKFVDYGSGKGDHILFPGPGWVFADKVRFLINDANLRKAADSAASVVMKLSSPDQTSGPDAANIDHVFGCAGSFADVAVHMANGPTARGWATRICSNQVTTCP